MTKRISKRSADEKQILKSLLEKESKLNLRGEAMVSESTSGLLCKSDINP